MPSNASVTLIGHIGEPKVTQHGEHLVARFGLAVTRKRKDSEITSWFNVTCWRKDAEFVQKYVKKGQLLMVEGDIWEDEYEGKKSMKVEAKRVMNLSPRQDAPEATERPAPAARNALPARAAVADFDDTSPPPF